MLTSRQIGRHLALELGFESTEVTLIAAAISEVSRNIVEYAKRGEIILRPLNHGAKQGLCGIARDRGPGIPDSAQAMRDRYTSGRGLGGGLPGAQRLVDEVGLR